MNDSPYEQTLDLTGLDPELKRYFGAIGDRNTGVGAGVFDVVGTPRVWLWSALWVLSRQGVLFPAWRRSVPFTVRNHPVVDAYGNTAILAERTFRFHGGERTMIDAITAERGRLVDYLGTHRRYRARLSGWVTDGALHLASTAMAVRFGRFALPVPRRFAPTVTITERFDHGTGRQRVAVVLSAPVLGELYRYEGSFTYQVLEGVA